MASIDSLFESSTFDVFVPALPLDQETSRPLLDDLVLAHELDYALFDEKLTVYVMGRVQLPESASSTVQDNENDDNDSNNNNNNSNSNNKSKPDQDATVPIAIQSLFKNLTVQLDATIVEPIAPSSPVFSPSDSNTSSLGTPTGRPVSPLPPGQQPVRMDPSTPTPTLQPPSPHASAPTSPVIGPSGTPQRTLPRRSSSIRNVSLSPGLGPRRNSEMRQLSDGWAGTQIFQEKQLARDSLTSDGDIQRYNEQWGCVFQFTVPVSFIKIGDRSRTLLLTATITKLRSSVMGDEKNIANMAESKIMMTTTVPQIVANGNGTDAISDAPISESPRRGSIASITSINADVPDVVIDDSNDSSRVPTATPVSRSTSGIQANEGIIKKSATKTMSVRSAVNTIAKVTWTSLLENTLILAIDIDNEVNASHDITLNSLKVDITSAVLRPCGPHFDQAVKLLPGDQYTQLYHLTILDDDRKPSIQPPPPQMMVPSFARPGPDGEFPQLFTPAQIESKLREVRLQLSCTVHTATEEIMKREVNSDWRFFVDSSDAAKRRVQEQFRSGGARTVRVFPPSEPMTPQGGPRPGRPSGGSGTPSGGGTPNMLSPSAPNSTRPMLAVTTGAGAGGAGGDIKGRGRRAFTLDRTNEDSSFGGPGLVISFSVNGPVIYEQEFVVEAFLVNRSHRTKNFTVLIPSRQSVAVNTQRYRRPTIVTETRAAGLHVDTHMRGDTIIEKQRRSLQNHASLVCLDNHIRLSPLQPGACLSVYLHFVPFREHFNTIELVQLFDKDTGSMTSLRDVLDVYVQPSA